jgi:hypothetical protein
MMNFSDVAVDDHVRAAKLSPQRPQGFSRLCCEMRPSKVRVGKNERSLGQASMVFDLAGPDSLSGNGDRGDGTWIVIRRQPPPRRGLNN